MLQYSLQKLSTSIGVIMRSLILFFMACSGKAPDTSSTETGTPEVTDPSQPVAPEPFTLSLSGEATETLLFDKPTCTIPNGAANLYAFWRLGSGEHKFLIKAELRNIYEGIGTYSETDGAVIKLQEEAGGEGRYFEANEARGSTVTVEIEGIMDDIVWGTATVSELFTDTGSVTIDPNFFPIWCTAENTN